MPRFEYASDQSLLVYLGEGIDLATHRRVLKLLRSLEAAPVAGVRNLHPAYDSMLVVFDPCALDHAALEAGLQRRIETLDSIELPAPRTVEIPVCYGGEFGPDLDELAALHAITADRVVELHSSAQYLVYFVGFVPGFAYLGGMPDELATPRLKSPRKRVSRGSVAIGASHTGIYPFETPGGWRLIGKTPLEIFDPQRAELSRLIIGDQVRFTPISRREFDELRCQ